MDKQPIIFTISPRRIYHLMGIITALLIFLHIAGRIVRFGFGYDHALGFVPMFNLGYEYNVPTLYSSWALLFAALLCLLVGLARRSQKQNYVFHWIGLSSALLFASVDEILALHERIDAPLRSLLGTSGLLHYAWIIPYIFACILGGLIYLPFFFQLPKSFQKSLLISVAIFVPAALGLEALEGVVVSTIGVVNFYNLALLTIEESLEMIATAIFVFGLLQYIESVYGGLHIVLSQGTLINKNSQEVESA